MILNRYQSTWTKYLYLETETGEIRLSRYPFYEGLRITVYDFERERFIVDLHCETVCLAARALKDVINRFSPAK